DLRHDARADDSLPGLHLQHPLVSAVSAGGRVLGLAADRMRVYRVRRVYFVAVREPGDGGDGHHHAAAVFLDSQLERGGVHQLVARTAARVLVVRSVRQLRQRRDRSRSRYLLRLFHRLFSVSHAALDGGTQVDRPALNNSSTAQRRSIWMNYAVLFYTAIA